MLCERKGPIVTSSLWMRLREWLSSAFAVKTSACADAADGVEKTGDANAQAKQVSVSHTTVGTAVKTAAEQRAAMLQAVARKKNNVPPQIRVRGFDRTRVSQMPIKRYNRAR